MNAFWGAAATALSALGVIFFGVKNKTIPLTWGAKTMYSEGITSKELDDKLQVHCSRRQQSLDAKLEMIFASQNKLSDTIIDIRERIARIEGQFHGDHK